jgi:hypothetical protein
MVWSYSGDPNSSPKDAVRFYVQDIIRQDPQVNDEEIDFLLTAESANVLRTAARTAEVIAAKYARQVDKSVGGLSLSAGRRQEKYEKLASTLWDRSRGVGPGDQAALAAVPYSGGISQSDKDAKASNPDRVVPIFRVDLHEFDTWPDPDSNP